MRLRATVEDVGVHLAAQRGREILVDRKRAAGQPGLVAVQDAPVGPPQDEGDDLLAERRAREQRVELGAACVVEAIAREQRLEVRRDQAFHVEALHLADALDDAALDLALDRRADREHPGEQDREARDEELLRQRQAVEPSHRRRAYRRRVALTMDQGRRRGGTPGPPACRRARFPGMPGRDRPQRPAFSRGFRRFLWTRLLGTTANQMLMVALAWQMYDLTGRAWDLGMVGLDAVRSRARAHAARRAVGRPRRPPSRARGEPSRCRRSRRSCSRGAACTAGSAATSSSAMCVVLGVARALQMPSQQAIVPALVERRRAAARVRRALDAAQDRGDRRAGARRVRLRVRAGGRLRAVPRVPGRVASRSIAAIARSRRRATAPPVSFETLFGRLRVHLAQEAGAGRHLARPLRRAARRRDGAAADLRQGHPRDRARGDSASCARRPRWARSLVGVVLAQRPLERHVGPRMFVVGRDLRRVDRRVRPVARLRAVVRRARDRRRRRHGERRSCGRRSCSSIRPTTCAAA